MRTFGTFLLFTLMFSVLSAFSTFNPGYKLGEYVAPFSLTNVDGKTVSLTDYNKAKGVILIFTCNTCPYAKLYEDRILALDAKFAAKGYPVLAVNPNNPDVQPGDSMEEMQKRAKEKNYSFPYLQDGNNDIARAFGATRTPQVFLLQRDSKGYKLVYIGAIDNNHKDAKAADKKYVEDAVNALLAGKQPADTETKAIGCTIKWKEA